MTQKHFFADFDAAALTPEFDGQTYSPEQDHDRLSTALGRVYAFLSDGQWRTLTEIALAAGCSESGASARLRDYSKPKFRAIYLNEGVEKRRLSGGLWQYRLRGAK
jgi:hypothetical protein